MVTIWVRFATLGGCGERNSPDALRVNPDAESRGDTRGEVMCRETGFFFSGGMIVLMISFVFSCVDFHSGQSEKYVGTG